MGLDVVPPEFGSTLRIVHAPGRRRMWRPSADVAIEMPVGIELVYTDPDTGEEVWRFEATVSLVGRSPEFTDFRARAADGLDAERMQREFRWSFPLYVVTTILPQLVAEGIDPFEADLTEIGFADVAQRSMSGPATLDDEFLEQIARDYLEYGRGYTRRIAAERGTTVRTVVSWVEKARARGILSPAPGKGRVGGHIIPPEDRAPSIP